MVTARPSYSPSRRGWESKLGDGWERFFHCATGLLEDEILDEGEDQVIGHPCDIRIDGAIERRASDPPE